MQMDGKLQPTSSLLSSFAPRVIVDLPQISNKLPQIRWDYLNQKILRATDLTKMQTWLNSSESSSSFSLMFLPASSSLT
jgi:hypothetical protein